MTKSDQSSQQTMQLIVDVLSFEFSDEDLKQQLGNSLNNWDQLVTIASRHLLLPAVYCRLQQKSLLDFLPEDLVSYLKDLTQLNRERNQTLLLEVQNISKLFQTHHIQHTFIKGTALLAGNYYKDISERMIGDIDILVASKDLDNAFVVLVNAGYDQFVSFNYVVKNYRHRPRQISDQHLGAVELHDQLLKHTFNHLIDKDALLQNIELVNGVCIPNEANLVWNSILAQQINDKGFYYNTLNLKSVYDILVLGLPQNKQLIEDLSNQKHGLGFLNLTSIFYPGLSPSAQTFYNGLKKRWYQGSLSFPTISKHTTYIKATYIGIIERVNLILNNKSYRSHIIKNKLN